jgi:hypothetical protein
VTWVGWRLQRTETLVAGAVLVALAILLVPQGAHMGSAFASGNLGACIPARSPTCGLAISGFLARFTFIRGVLDQLRLTPGVIGVLLAAPLILELENGTYRLAWTQGVTRRRLLAARLGIAVVTCLLAAGAFALLSTWSRVALDRLVGRMESGTFDIEWIVPLGCAVFALGLALAIGVATRRTGVSLVVAFAGYVGCRILVDTQLRPHYLTPVIRRFAIGNGLPDVNRDLVLSEHLIDKAGRPFTVTSQIVSACRGGSNGSGGDCLARHGAAFVQLIYQPAGRFWALQGIETAIFAGVGVALIVLAAVWLDRRAS